MRLTCPNCGAQYEVPGEVIPQGGRDVQCSNCGETWFQAHPDHPGAAPVDTDPSPADEAPDWVEDEFEGESQGEAPGDEVEDAAAAARRGLAPDIAGVLREEAAREAEARAAEARGGVESQPELGLNPPENENDRRSHQAKARMARLQGTSAPREEAEDDDIEPGSRRDFLPDIDEISSTISANPTRAPRDISARDGSRVAPGPARRGGFGRGMRLALLLAIIATALYILAPRLGAALPALDGPLAAYVETIDGLRARLHDGVSDIAATLRGG